MIAQATVELVSALAVPAERSEAAQRLAQYLGAATLLILVHDPTADAYLPAPGFAQTLPGGPSWRAFLERARQPGLFSGDVGYPLPTQLIPAVSYSAPGIILVFIGAAGDPNRFASIGSLVPLLAASLTLEHAALMARGELKVAQERAHEAEHLARALDATRSEVERTVKALGHQARELDEARGRAEAATLAKDQFLAMLGHELRNPLAPIVTALQLMRLKNKSSREQDIIERQVQSLTRLVDDLLDVSRITQGKIALRKERLEFAEIAARAIEMSTPVLEQKRQVLQVAIPSRGLMVNADPSRLAQVLANLLTNAAKYSDAAMRIDFSAELHAGRVRIGVKDQGIGIRPELIDRVFEPFVQNRQGLERSQGGLGLGLAIVRSLVTLHGGTVSAFSPGEGKGSEFVVELPQAGPELVSSGNAAPTASAFPFATISERVLVVDDNEDAAELLAEALRALGYVVRAATNGPNALQVAGTFRPHVAVLDIGLPVMDGYELARRLRAVHPMTALRLVAITGYGRREDRLRSEEVGFDAHLIKPIDLDQLQAVLERMRRKAPPLQP